MDRAVRLEYQYHDVDLVELKVTAWNGRFGGTTKLWVAQDELAEVAGIIEGFPRSHSDRREIVLGAFGPKFAGGAMSIGFSCIDQAGHSRLQIMIESDDQGLPEPESVKLISPFEPAALDRFVEEMKRLSSNLQGCATLNLAEL
jgi:hypothetical protein